MPGISPYAVAAVVRAAYRALPDFSGPPIATPMGPVPAGLGAVVSQGPDVALVGSLPVVAAFLLGGVPTAVLLAQAAAALAVLALVARPPGTQD